MTKYVFYLILLCLDAVVASEVYYTIRPSQSQSCGNSYVSHTECSMANDLTLSQFINNINNFLTNNTRLIFSSGNYSLIDSKSELVVQDVHSFSMSVWPGSSSKALIICSYNARFEFRNVSTVTVSGLEFIGCLEHFVIYVVRFQVENSGFFGNDQAMVNGTVMSIEESSASLDRVAFMSTVEKLETSATPQVPEDCLVGTIKTTNAVIRILSKSSNI